MSTPMGLCRQLAAACLLLAGGAAISVAHAADPAAMGVKAASGTGILNVTGNERLPVIEYACQPGVNVEIEVLPYVDAVAWKNPRCLCAETPEAAKQKAIQFLRDSRDGFVHTDNTSARPLEPGEPDVLKLYCYDTTKLVEQFLK